MKSTLLLMASLAAAPVVADDNAPQDVVLLDFTADYCEPCRRMVPAIQRMQQDRYPIRQIDISERPELSAKFGVQTIPTFILLENGQETRRLHGLQSEETLRRLLLAARDRQQKKTERPDPTAGASLPDFFRRALAEGMGGVYRRPVVRAQDGNAAGGNDVVERMRQSTVLVTVNGTQFQDVGSGTLVFSEAGRSVVLTCAHLFQEANPSDTIRVEIYGDEVDRHYPAEFIGSDEESDVAFLEIRNTTPLPIMPLNREVPTVEEGDSVVSFGCNSGQAPTLMATKVLAVDYYLGPGHLLCEGDQVQGRSGGGLFLEDGTLVGVCSAADRKKKRGLYMSRPTIDQLAARLDLDFIYQTKADASPVRSNTSPSLIASASSPATDSPAATAEPQIDAATAAMFDSATAASRASVSPQPDLATELEADLMQPSSEQSFATMPTQPPTMELKILISSSDPKTPSRVVVIPDADPWLMELLTGQRQSPESIVGAAPVTLTPAAAGGTDRKNSPPGLLPPVDDGLRQQIRIRREEGL